MRAEYIEAVLAVADLIPPAHVLSYGDIAVLLESGGPRQVGAVMSAQGSMVPWWRVIRANGAAPVCHAGTALQHYQHEQTPLRGDTANVGPGAHKPSWRVNMDVARWRPTEIDFLRIDALAAGLRPTSDVDRPADGSLPVQGESGNTPRHAAPMSVPRDGLKP